VTRTLLERGVDFAIGMLTFTGAHAVEVAMWRAWFGGEHEPWFLNSASAAGFTLGCVLIASGLASMRGGSAPPGRGVSLALGAFAAMAVVLFLKEGGPGTIFPIVLVAGGVFLLISSTLGAWIGREVRRAAKGR
jgi:hypothetical protein